MNKKLIIGVVVALLVALGVVYYRKQCVNVTVDAPVAPVAAEVAPTK